LAKGSGTIATLASIPLTEGSAVGGLVMDSSGNLYGTTAGKGLSGGGIVFELAQGSGTITTLASLSANSNAPLVLDNSGNLYGTTAQAGLSFGTIFELAKGSGTITTLATFSGSPNGVEAVGGLVMDNSGNLYGTAVNGPVPGGTVFELAKGSGKITTLVSIPGTEGSLVGGLVVDSSGNLYGTGANEATSGGTVFELAKGSGTITTLATFSGSTPTGGLVVDSSGNLYGTTGKGGSSNAGTVFEVAQGSGTITTLASFNGTNGENPNGYPIMDSSGNLYGTTAGGNLGSGRVVYELTSGAAGSGSGGNGGGAGNGGGSGGQQGNGGNGRQQGNGGGSGGSAGSVEQQGGSTVVFSFGGFSFPLNLPAPGQSAGVFGMALEEFELVLNLDLAFIFSAMGQPNQQYNDLVLELSTAINNDPMPLPWGWFALQLGYKEALSLI
jgi:uncharacterized repeat protein (TIGR03803 family)